MMPSMNVNVMREKTKAQYVLLSYAAPNRPSVPIGVLLLVQNQLLMRFVTDWDTITTDEDDWEILSNLRRSFEEMSKQLGPAGFMAWVRDTLSNTIQISDAGTIAVDEREMHQALNRVYESFVGSKSRREVS